MKRPRLAGNVTHVLYDLDGLLLDTEHIYTVATQEVVGEYGKSFDWTLKSNMIGRPSIESARYLVDALDLPLAPEEYLELRRTRLEAMFPDTEAKPGARAFTAAVAALGVPQAVATSSERALFELKITRHRDWFATFEALVTGDDPRVASGKPAPDIFLVAADDLGAKPSQCLVFEDAPAGVEAARAAGMLVVAIPDPAMDRDHFRDANLVIESFEEIEPTDFELGGEH